MTEKELRKLKRSELLEIMYYLQKELETVQAENESLKQKLEKEECFRGQSGDKTVADNGSNEKDAKINKDGRQRAGKQKNG